NRADLVFQVTEVVEGYTAVNPPLADDSELIRERLLGVAAKARSVGSAGSASGAIGSGAGAGAGAVAIICDNAGRELISDLLLADELLSQSGTALATSVELHVKPAPYYISDATA